MELRRRGAVGEVSLEITVEDGVVIVVVGESTSRSTAIVRRSPDADVLTHMGAFGTRHAQAGLPVWVCRSGG